MDDEEMYQMGFDDGTRFALKEDLYNSNRNYRRGYDKGYDEVLPDKDYTDGEYDFYAE